MLLLMDVAKLFCREGIDRVDLSMLESPLLEPRRSSGSASGKAHGKPLVGAAAMGSGIPETLLGLGLMTGARRGGWFERSEVLGPKGERGGGPPFGR